METYCNVFVTAKDVKEGEKIQSALVKERLAACVKILDNVRSAFTWKGKVEKANEVLLIIETKTSSMDKVLKRIKKLHSYKTPAISAIPIIKGNDEYLAWINEVTK